MKMPVLNRYARGEESIVLPGPSHSTLDKETSNFNLRIRAQAAIDVALLSCL